MPKIRFIANWSAEIQQKLKIPRGYVVFQFKKNYRESLGKVLMELDKYQKNKFASLKSKEKEFTPDDWQRDLEIDIEYHYRKRTIDQNKLMWELYTIEANEYNGGQGGAREQVLTKDELYLNDLREYGERDLITTKRKNYGYYLDDYKIIEAVILADGTEYPIDAFLRISMSDDEKITLRVVRGSSKFNTKEMSIWINRIFNRLAYNGVQVTNPGEIKDYWFKWRQFLNDEKLVVHDSILTQSEYKALNPICEGCGEFIQAGTGHLHHIKAFGMGADRTEEPRRNYASNWLHFCVKCHGEWHQAGWKAFIKNCKWLAYKVLTALNRDYTPLEDWQESTQTDQDVKSYQDDKESPSLLNVAGNGEPLKAIEDRENRVYYHPESCSIFIDVYPRKSESADDMEVVELGRISESTRLHDVIKDLLDKKSVNLKEACMVFYKIGLDPSEIDPKWIGIF